MSSLASTHLPVSGRHDPLTVLILVLYFTTPLQILMVIVGPTKLTAGIATAAAIGLIGLLLFASSHLGFSLRADRPILYLLLFLCLATVSTARTAYGIPAIQKGATNLLAMFAMISMMLVVKQAILQWPDLLRHIVRIIAIVTGLAASTVVFQSIVSNVFLMPELFDLSFVNSLLGETWWELTQEGGLVRAHGIYAEPAHLATYVGIASGFALMRLGLLGSRGRRDTRGIVPLWAAVGILGSLVVSFSVVAYAGLLVVYLGALASSMRFSIRSIMLFLTGSAAAILVVALLAMQAGGAIVERIAGLTVFQQLDVDATNSLTSGRGINLSVQVLFFNAYVTLQNLMANPLLGAGAGAHPFAFDALVPALPLLPTAASSAIRTGAMDASSLALRLLSETGVLGTAIFTLAIISAWWRVRKVVLVSAADLDSGFITIAIALNAGLAGVFAAMMFRNGSYYAAEFWAVLALCVAVPLLAENLHFRSFNPVSRSSHDGD